jgi:hypothetical protein
MSSQREKHPATLTKPFGVFPYFLLTQPLETPQKDFSLDADKPSCAMSLVVAVLVVL